MEGRYTKYYLTQDGSGLGDIGILHRGPLIYQRGRGGIGDFFSTVIRTLRPLVTSGLSALKDQSLKTGSAILRDIGQKPINNILQEQGSLALQQLTEKGLKKLKRTMQSGKGIKRKVQRGRSQLRSKRRKRCGNSSKGKNLQLGGRRKKRSTKRKTAKRRQRTKTRNLDIFD